MEKFTKVVERSRYKAFDDVKIVDRYTTAVEQTIKWVPATWKTYPMDERVEPIYGEYAISYNGNLEKWHLKSSEELLNDILNEDYGCEAVVYICDRNGEEHQATDSEVLSILKECKSGCNAWWVAEGEAVEETDSDGWTGHSWYDLTIHEHTNFFWLDGGELVGPKMEDLNNYEERIKEVLDDCKEKVEEDANE